MSFILSPAEAIIEPIDAPVDLLTNTAAPYYAGGSYTWTITNFDSFTTYTVTTTNGTVSQASGTITYTPASGGAGGFTVNNRVISLTVTAFPQLSAGTSAIFATGQAAGILSLAQLTTSTVAIFYCSFANNGLYAVVASISGTVVTYGSTVLVRSNFSPQIASICALSSTLCLVGYETVAGNLFGTRTLSISGTTITVNAEVTNAIVSQNVVMCALTATTALAMFNSSLVVISVAGTVPSFGTAVSTGIGSNYRSISPLSSTKAVILYDGNSSYPTCNAVSIAGTVVTIGTALVIQSVATGQGNSVIALNGTDAIAQFLFNSSPNSAQVAPLTISGTTVTAGTVTTLSTSQQSAAAQAAVFITANNAACVYIDAAGAGVGVAAIYNALTLATGSVTTLVPGANIGRLTGVFLDTNKLFCIFNTGTASASGVVITVT